MRYFLIAGEASGDLHGANLVRALKSLDPQAECTGWGGDNMSGAGVALKEHYKNTAFMGFVEVILHLRKIIGFLSQCKKDITSYQPDAIILIDYPGFNLRIAKWAHSRGIRVVYYITPQVWAWHTSRVHTLGKCTHLLLTILPFESSFFAKYGYRAHFVGHPLLDALESFQRNEDFEQIHKTHQKMVALLPGSRKQEIQLILPVMLQAMNGRSEKIFLAGAPAIPDSIYLPILQQHDPEKKVVLVRNQTYDILSIADKALVGSGTATLETALFKVPQVVCYKGSSVSIAIAKRLVKLPFISLVNLISDKKIVTELIQDDLTPGQLRKEIDLLDKNREEILAGYETLVNMLGNKGASERAAAMIINTIQP